MTHEDGTNDTSPAAEAILIAGFRTMPAWRKLQRVNELTALTRSLAREDVRRRYPDASQREISLRVASRWLDPALLRAWFDWDIEREGH